MRLSSLSLSLTSRYRKSNVFDALVDGPRRYISNIEMSGGTIRYIPLHPPNDGASRTSSAAEWTIDFNQLEKEINPKTKMIVRTHLNHSPCFHYLTTNRCSTHRKQGHRCRPVDHPWLTFIVTIPLAKSFRGRSLAVLAHYV
jgi:hypothetical protein